ncbi:MAG TPA: hypothetical protein VF169_17505 [Albitalea sp.]|uniref:hypothetical protein n=1 Tax=Piscinibacter sp. TaxID=1903157 RepID=UPI002ED5D7B0
MRSLASNETVVKEGTFLYDGEIECDIRIVHSPVRYGSGDHEDPPEVENDLAQSTFYIQYGSTTERAVFNSGGGGYPTLAEAVAAAAASPGIGSTIRWRKSANAEA